MTYFNLVSAPGYQIEDDDNGKVLNNYTTTRFRVNPDYACSVFTSCKKVSMIA